MRTALGLALALWWSVARAAPVHHALEVVLDPDAGRLEVTDRVTLPEPPEGRRVRIILHRGLSPKVVSPGATITPAGKGPGPTRGYRVWLREGRRTFVLRYGGPVRHPPEGAGGYAGGFPTTPGTIEPEGVYLSAESGWYPVIEDRPVTFDLRVLVPEGWGAVSQGGGGLDGRAWRWSCPDPQDEIYLVAGPFTVYRRPADAVEAQVYLRAPDRSLAERYLGATVGYLEMYGRLIGPYPYPKFALVENFWDTGWGMPSFTLLGPRIIRFPFILVSSYPHEILHNWWGNSVYVAYGEGNWCEGLTAYLADHLIQEARGNGAEYRQGVLQKYADYAARSRDFPLTRFRARHSAATEAVGYGKALMLYHMLRLRVGDEAFVAGLRSLYRTHRFRKASWQDVRVAFEGAAGRPLEDAFLPWLERQGAPWLRLQHVRARRRGARWKLELTLQQDQPAMPYPLEVPVAVTLRGEPGARRVVVPMTGRRVSWHGWFPSQPLRVDVDPEFDLFRRLEPLETPPALSGVFGAETVAVVLPSGAPGPLLAAYRALARAWAEAQPGTWRVQTDREPVPPACAVWILGWENRLLPWFRKAVAPYGVVFSAEGAAWDGNGIYRETRWGVLAARRPDRPEAVVAWIGASSPEPLPGLARKLPHYHKYSYLVFEGDEPVVTAKGRWPVTDSPMTAQLGDTPVPRGTLPPRRALARPPPEAVSGAD